MCGRLIASDMTWAELFAQQRGFLDELNITKIDSDAPDAKPGPDIRPTNQVSVAINGSNGLIATTARWWFVPHKFSGTPKEWTYTTFNARLESAAQSRSFGSAWNAGRCVLPVCGYYEWQKIGKGKQPWTIAVQTNAPVFFMAGLYESMQDGTATCAILTRAPAPALEHIHNRMPVMLTEAEIAPWMASKEPDDEVIETLGTHWDDRFQIEMGLGPMASPTQPTTRDLFS